MKSLFKKKHVPIIALVYNRGIFTNKVQFKVINVNIVFKYIEQVENVFNSRAISQVSTNCRFLARGMFLCSDVQCPVCNTNVGSIAARTRKSVNNTRLAKLVQLVFHVSKERHFGYGILRDEFHFAIERTLEFFETVCEQLLSWFSSIVKIKVYLFQIFIFFLGLFRLLIFLS